MFLLFIFTCLISNVVILTLNKPIARGLWLGRTTVPDNSVGVLCLQIHGPSGLNVLIIGMKAATEGVLGLSTLVCVPLPTALFVTAY